MVEIPRSVAVIDVIRTRGIEVGKPCLEPFPLSKKKQAPFAPKLIDEVCPCLPVQVVQFRRIRRIGHFLFVMNRTSPRFSKFSLVPIVQFVAEVFVVCRHREVIPPIPMLPWSACGGAKTVALENVGVDHAVQHFWRHEGQKAELVVSELITRVEIPLKKETQCLAGGRLQPMPNVRHARIVVFSKPGQGRDDTSDTSEFAAAQTRGLLPFLKHLVDPSKEKKHDLGSALSDIGGQNRGHSPLFVLGENVLCFGK